MYRTSNGNWNASIHIPPELAEKIRKARRFNVSKAAQEGIRRELEKQEAGE
jgi:post-segregation antitoxin (ccd killing protein)